MSRRTPTVRYEPGKPLNVRHLGEDDRRIDEGREPSAWMGDAIWAAVTVPRTVGFIGAFAAIAVVAYLFAFEWWGVVAIAVLVAAALLVRHFAKRLF